MTYILRTYTTLNGHKNIFYDSFGDILWLHDKIINGSFRGIMGNSDAAMHLRCIISRAAPRRKVLGGKYNRSRRSPKTVKIEGYKSHF